MSRLDCTGHTLQLYRDLDGGAGWPNAPLLGGGLRSAPPPRTLHIHVDGDYKQFAPPKL